MKKRILFITQSLSRTGSEMVLWYLLNNLDPEKYAISILCLKKGELYDHLPDHIDKHIRYKSSSLFIHHIFRAILKLFKIDEVVYQVKQIQRSFNADILYINTIVVPDVFDVAKQSKAKTILHVHELLYAFSFIKAKVMERLIANSDVCIGCSEVVCEKIADLNHANIKLQHSFIDLSTISTDAVKVAKLRSDLGILPTDFVWVISGVANYMKGIDRVLPLLDEFQDERIKILWIGMEDDSGLNYYVKTVANLKYPNRLIFAGALSTDYYDYMSIGNGFLLLSREESFSLVMVEAVYLGLPVVALNVGIVNQFVTESVGKIVHDWVLEDFVEAMNWVMKNLKPNKLQMKDQAMQYDISRQLHLYELLLEEIVKI